MMWSAGGRDSDERWVLERSPRDPRGLWPPTRVELVVYATAVVLVAGVAMLLRVW